MTFTISATLFALLAFAANSILCRLALGGHHVDAYSFTAVRLISGATFLALMARPGAVRAPGSGHSWRPAVALATYAFAFSLAYVNLSAGTGALLLFGAVQATMLFLAVTSGDRPRAGEWLGIAVALGGMTWLVAPGIEAPPPMAALLMATAGIAWGLYSALGRRSTDPGRDTARNFARAVPIAAGAWLLAPGPTHVSTAGLALASVSGALASALGYVAWYSVLPRLTATRAAAVQLAVPVLTAFAGVVALAEPLTVRLALASALVVAGIGLGIVSRSRAGLRQ